MRISTLSTRIRTMAGHKCNTCRAQLLAAQLPMLTTIFLRMHTTLASKLEHVKTQVLEPVVIIGSSMTSSYQELVVQT